MSIDVLTEIYVDSTGYGHFWPHNASVYATLFAAATKAIKAELNDDAVLFAGPNVIPTNSANKEFFTSFIEACYKLGYDECPLDLATLHYFSTDATRPGVFGAWIHSQLTSVFDQSASFPTPRMAIT